MWRRLVLVLALLPFVAQGAPVSADRTVPFEVKDGFMWVEVRIPQSDETLNFLVDTGAEVSTLNLQTAKRLNLRGGRPVKVAGVGGRATGYWPLKLQATVASVEVPERFLVTDLCGLQASCQCPVDGLLGADFFEGRITRIDFDAREITFLAVAPTQTRNSVPIRFRRSIMQVPVAVDGGSDQWVRLDTGCASPLEWVCAKSARRATASRLSIGLTGVWVPTVHTRVQLGSCSFDKVETGMHERPIFASERGLLGLGMLSRFKQVIIDTRGGRLVLSGPLQ